MIIHSLTIENIYSLKGKHHIDFNNIGKFTNLLAITGKTGAGKSTILNSISLALFGKTHLKALVKEDYITLGEKKGTIELDFTVKGKQYSAYWSITAKGSLTRRLQTPKELKTSKINEEIESIIKLNFDQFTKTVILNQGEFANFITSSFAQRKDILEELVNIKNLKYLSKQIRSDIKLIEQQNSNILSKLEASSIVTPEEIEELINSVKEQKNALNLLKKKFVQLKSLKDLYSGVCNNAQKLIENRENIISYTEKSSEITTKQNQLKAIQKELKEISDRLNSDFQKIRPSIEQAYELENKRNLQLYKLTELHATIEKEQERKVSKKNDLEQWQQEQQVLTQEIQDLKQELQIISSPKSTNDIKQCLKFLAAAKTHQQTLEHLHGQIEDKKSYLQKIEANHSQLESEQNELQAKIVTHHEETILKSSKEIQQQIVKVEIKKQEHAKNLENIKNAEKRIAEYDSILKDLITSKQNAETELKLLIKERDLCKEKMKSEQLQNAIILIQNENKMHSECLVCHAPIQKMPPHSLSFSTTSDHENKIEEITQQIDLKKESIHQLDKNSDINKQQQLETKVLLQSYQNSPPFNQLEYEQLCQKRDMISQQLEQLRLNKNTLGRIQKEIEKTVQDKSETSGEIERQLELTNKQFELFNEINSKIYKQIQKEHGVTELPIDSTIHYLQLTERYLHLHKNVKMQTDELERLSKEIESKQIEAKETEQSIKWLLQQITKLVEGNDSIHKYEQQWIDRIEADRQKLQHNQSEIDQLELERRELTGRMELLQRQEELIKKDSMELFESTHLEKLSEDTQIPKAMQFIDKVEAMMHTPSAQQVTELKFLIEDLIDSPAHAIEQEMELMKAEISKKEERLNIQQEQEQKQVALNKELDILYKTLGPKKDLELIIGNDDFRNYLLSLVESQLLELSNLELESLCQGRYSLYHHENEYYISDGHKGAELRKISTLSGGEKFMVSLSMALGLAEMTRGETEIDSFFIDEGFGTLDEESLDEIVDVLQNVQSRGKFVTIITHVKELSRRLPVNLHVKKQHLGNSVLEMIHN